MTYAMLYKPAGYVCARKDLESPTVMEFFPASARETLFPLGRLDKYTEGLLLMTDDGKLNYRLLDPARQIEKRYLLWAVGEPEEAMCRAIREGMVLKGLPEPTKPARIEILSQGRISDIAPQVFPIRRPLLEENPSLPVFCAHLWLTEGKRHQVKRMLEATGHLVVALKREAFAGLELDSALSPGQSRPLTDTEIAALRALADLN